MIKLKGLESVFIAATSLAVVLWSLALLPLGRSWRRLGTLGHELDHVRDEVALGRELAENGVAVDAADLDAWRGRFAAYRRRHADGLKRLAESAEQIDAAYHPYWGSLFKQGTSKTRFAGQLDSYACLYTARARNFAFYGSQHYYRVAQDPMMHELEDR